jgi:hypothetical protein
MFGKKKIFLFLTVCVSLSAFFSVVFLGQRKAQLLYRLLKALYKVTPEQFKNLLQKDIHIILVDNAFVLLTSKDGEARLEDVH